MYSWKIKLTKDGQKYLSYASELYEETDNFDHAYTLYPDNIPDYLDVDDWVYVDDNNEIHLIDTRISKAYDNLIHKLIYTEDGKMQRVEDIDDSDLKMFLMLKMRRDNYLLNPILLSGEEEKEFIKHKNEDFDFNIITCYKVKLKSDNKKVLKRIGEVFTLKDLHDNDSLKEIPDYIKPGDWTYIDNDGIARLIDTRPLDKYEFSWLEFDLNKAIRKIYYFNYSKNKEWAAVESKQQGYILCPNLLDGEEEQEYVRYRDANLNREKRYMAAAKWEAEYCRPKEGQSFVAFNM